VADDPIDAATLDELLATLGGDGAFLAELIATYLADSPPLVDAMRAAAAAGDAAALRRAAHTLKSTSASLGALRLSGVCREVEGAASADRVPADLVEEAAREYARVSEALAARADAA
jgi:HPt (histidine-containing phosphotransfer) domain-containing protein